MMKKTFWVRCLSVFLLLAFLLCLTPTQIVLAQTTSAYDQDMQLGYAATAQRNYPSALSYFKQALQERPGDRYASTAVNNVQSYIQNRRQASLAFVSNIGEPGRRESSASRGLSCADKGEPPTPLTPANEPSLTTVAHPTLFIYVPQNSAQVLEFTLQDSTSNQELYKATIKPSKQAGVVSVSLSTNSNAPSLENGKEYTWSFSVVCDTQNRDQDLKAAGSIERIQTDPNLMIQLQKAQSRERAALYATSGIWLDTLTSIAEIQRSHPNDPAVKMDWEDLLKSVGLEKVTQAPLL
ncbi:MAG: DUF928 domain-containing protein [Rhizonema sp. PD38]|nr:DUF928 domain-containing protein [Rhizonema sp. PD38]